MGRPAGFHRGLQHVRRRWALCREPTACFRPVFADRPVESATSRFRIGQIPLLIIPTTRAYFLFGVLGVNGKQLFPLAYRHLPAMQCTAHYLLFVFGADCFTEILGSDLGPGARRVQNNLWGVERDASYRHDLFARRPYL